MTKLHLPPVFGALVALASVAAIMATLAAQAGTPTPKNGRVGFVVADINYAGATNPISDSSCPLGRSKGYREIYAESTEGRRAEGETDQAYTRRLEQGIERIATHGDTYLCESPQAGHDPFYRTMNATNVTVIGGIDLDGRSAGPHPATCTHTAFNGANGERGIDNQWLRVNGCRPASNLLGAHESGLTIEMLTGSWGILVALSDVDDLRNDDDVNVSFYANADPIQLSASRQPLRDASYNADADPRFRATAHGRIRNGVLTTEPVDMRFHSVLNGMLLERPLNQARFEGHLTPDGALDGYLAGYTPVEDMYDLSYGFRNGKRNGQLAPQNLRRNTAMGAASVLSYTCEGAYAALKALADGDRDPHTGQCNSISTQYVLHAIPAFVVD